MKSLCCGHCGSRLPSEQAHLYGAIVKKLARLGGDRADATSKGGDSQDGPVPEKSPKANGDTAAPQWPFETPTVCGDEGDDDGREGDGQPVAMEEPPAEPLNISGEATPEGERLRRVVP